MSVDIKLSRKMNINVGDFNRCDSEVTLILKDVETEDFTKKYLVLSKLVDCCLALETKAVLEESETARVNPQAYSRGLTDASKNIKNTLKTFAKEL